MRISTGGLRQNLIHTLNQSLERIERIEMEMATGKRILRPSDDPPGTIRSLALRRQLNDGAQYRRNIEDGLRWNTTTESALTAVLENLMQMKELATRAADAATDGREEIGFTADGLLEDLLKQSCTRIDDRYLFSGYNTGAPPFIESHSVAGESFTAGEVNVAVDLVHARIEEGSLEITDTTGLTTFVEGVDFSVDYASGRLSILAGGAMAPGGAYLANYDTEGISSVEAAGSAEGSIVRQIGKDRLAEVNLLGTDVFQGTTDVFQMAIDLKNALRKDDADAVGGLLDSIDEAIRHVSEMVGVVGGRSENLENQDLRLQSDQVALEAFLSDVESADLASAVVRLQSEQLAYQSALATAARMMEISLVNYL